MVHSNTSSTASLPTDKFVQVGDVAVLPDDIYMAHLDLYMQGTDSWLPVLPFNQPPF